MRSSQREVMPSICGVVLVVVARFRAAAVLRLCCGSTCSSPGSPGNRGGGVRISWGGSVGTCALSLDIESVLQWWRSCGALRGSGRHEGGELAERERRGLGQRGRQLLDRLHE